MGPTLDAADTAAVVYLHPDEEVRTTIADALRSESIDVRPVGRADAARSLVEERAVDCLVTAYELPTTDAISFLSTLRADGITTPVILHPERGDERVAAEAIGADVSGYVPVPDSPIETVDALAETLAETLETTASTAALRRRWRTVESLHEVALEFETCTTPEETYQFAVEALAKVLDVYSCVIYVAEDGVLVPKATVGTLPGGWEPYGLEEGVAGRTYQTGESSYTGHIQTEADASPAGESLQSGISVPVGDFGVLQAVSDTRGAYTEHDRKLGELLAAHVSAAVSRIRSERAMRTERDRFATLFEHVPDPIAITRGEEARVVDVNPAFEEMFGFDRDAIREEPIDEYLVPEDGDAIDVIEAVGTGEVITDEIARRGVEETREFLFKGFAIGDEDDDYHEYGIYTDITDRKRRERELQQYKRLVEAVGDPMYILDADGRVEMANAAMADGLGISVTELVGRYPREFMPEPDVRAGEQAVSRIVESDERGWETFEMTVDPIDGEPFVAETKVSPLLDDDGSFTGSVGIIRDISRRKERERRIRDLHEGTRKLMAAEGSAAVATAATEVTRDALGLPINGIHLYDDSVGGLVPVAHTECALDLLGDPPTIGPGGGLMWDAYAAGEPMVHGDVTTADSVRNPETEVRSEAYIPLGEHGVAVISSTEVDAFDDEELALAKILGSNVEAALDRAEREATLARRTKELERQNERLDEFAGMVSHDLRNPLTLAAGHLEAARSIADEETRTHLDEVEWALDRMEDLIADVLELARNGQPLTETSEVDLEAAVAEAHRTVDADLEVTVEGFQEPIEASRQRLCALFENCLRNAIEHAGPDVSVTVRRTADGFAIDDDGPGIPPEKRETVLETGYTTAEEGTGFGLAIVADVVEAHDWSLAIEESPEGGARFHVLTDE